MKTVSKFLSLKIFKAQGVAEFPEILSGVNQMGVIPGTWYLEWRVGTHADFFF